MPKPKKTERKLIHDLTGTSDPKKLKAIRQLEVDHNKEFELCARDFWYFAQFLTTYDEENEEERLFPEFEYLKRVHSEVENHNKVIVLKSRRLLISWYGMARMLWRSKFAGCGLKNVSAVFSGAVMSIGELEAEELVRRVKFLHKNLPAWLQMRNDIIVNNQMYVEFDRGGKVRAFPLKREGPRTFGFSEVFFDEMAFQEAVRTVYTGMAPTLGAKGRLLAVSTPNGKGNLFADIWFNKNEKFSDIHRITLHWKENPEHGDEWYGRLAATMDDQMIARELGLSFAAYAGQPVWDKFEWQTHVWDVEKEKAELTVTPGKPVYHGWDMGYHFPAWTLWQQNSHDQWQGIAEVQGYDIEFEEFCKKIVEKCTALYDRRKVDEIHCVPPDAMKRSNRSGMSGAVNDLQDIQKAFKIYNRRVQHIVCPGEVGTRTNEAPRLKETRKLFKLRGDGRPGIIMNSTMEGFLEGCKGAYCYPEKGDTEQPEKNEASHLQDSGQSVFSAYSRVHRPKADKIKQQKKRDRIGSRTGL
jgi:hypothetical protein